jgi:hypothetical protein
MNRGDLTKYMRCIGLVIVRDIVYIDYDVGVYRQMDYMTEPEDMDMEHVDELIEVSIESGNISDNAVEFLSRLLSGTPNDAYSDFHAPNIREDVTIRCRDPEHFEKFNLKRIKFVCGSRAKSAR